MELSVLAVGDFRPREFDQPRTALAEHTKLPMFPRVADALPHIVHGGLSPQLIVVAQGRPGQVTARDVDALRRSAPLSPLVALLGSWCEGEMRSGDPWPANARVFWYEWPNWWARQLAALRQGGLAEWGWPLTCTRDERLLRELVPASAKQQSPLGATDSDASRLCDDQDAGCPLDPAAGAACRHVAIGGGTRASISALAEVLQLGGFVPQDFGGATQQRPRPAVDCGIWDAVELGKREQLQLRRFAIAIGERPLVLLLDLPTLDQWRMASGLGAYRVLGKPYQIADLLGSLGEAVQGDTQNVREAFENS